MKFTEREPRPAWALLTPQEELLREHLNYWVRRANAFFEASEAQFPGKELAAFPLIESGLHGVYNYIDRLDTEEEFSSTLGQLVQTFDELEKLTEQLQHRVEFEYSAIGVTPTPAEEHALKRMPEFLAKVKSSVALLTPSHVALHAHLELLIAYGSGLPQRDARAMFGPLREAHAQYFRHAEAAVLEAYRDKAEEVFENKLYRRCNQTAIGNRIAGGWMERELRYFWEQLEIQTLLAVMDD